MKNFFSPQSEQFLEYLQNNLSYSPLTIYTYRLNLREALASVEMHEEEGVWYVDMMPYRMQIHHLKKKTIYKKISIFKSFIAWLRDRDETIVLRNDETIKLPKTLPKPVPQAYIFEALEECDLQEKVLLLIVYALGLRISEVANLKLESIQNGWVSIKGKGAKIRQLPLLSEVQKQLQLYLKKYTPQSYLFEKSGQKMSVNQIRYRIEKIFKKRALRVTPHQLRHAFATDLLEGGARITDVSMLLGHASLETTQIYTKLSSSAKMKNYQKAHPLCRESDGFTSGD